MAASINCTHPLASSAGNVSTSELLSLLLQDELHEFFLKIPSLILMVLYVCLGIPGNIIVIIIYYFRFRSSTTKTFIVSLSTFDLINCVLGIPFEMVDLRYDIQLDLPALCKVLRFVVTFCACGSTLILLSVAVDRFRRICQPFKRQMSVRQGRYVVVGVALFSVAIAVPALVLYGRRSDVYRGVVMVDCTIDDAWAGTGLANGYQFSLGLLWVLSIVALCIMYGIIIHQIRQQEIRKLNMTANSIASMAISKFNSVASNGGGIHRKISTASCDREQIKDIADIVTTTTTSTTTKSTSRSQMTSISPVNEELHCCTSVENKIMSGVKGQESDQRQPVPLNRLFSRDVNPIYEEEDETHGEASRTNLCDITESNIEEVVTSQNDEVKEEHGIQNCCASQNEDVGDIRGQTTSDDSPTNVSMTLESDSYDEERNSSISRDDTKPGSPSSSLVAMKDNQTLGYDVSTRHTSSVPCLTDSGLIGHGGGNVNTNTDTNTDTDTNTNTDTNTDTHTNTNTDTNTNTNTTASLVPVPRREKTNADANVDTNVIKNYSRSHSEPIGKGSGNDTDSHSGPNQVCLDYHDGSWSSSDNNKHNNTYTPDIATHSSSKVDNTSTRVTCNVNLESKRNYSGISDNSPRLHASGKQYASDERSLDRITSTSDQTNGSVLTLHESKVAGPSRTRRVSSPVVRQVSINSYDGSADFKKRVKHASFSSQGSSSRVHKNSVTYCRQPSVGVASSSSRALKTSRIAVMMFHVTMGHVLSFLPHLAIQFHRALGPASLSSLLCNSVYFAFHHILLRSIYLNSSINPVIYSYNNSQFRSYCKQVLTKPLAFCRRRRSTYVDSAHSVSMD